MIMSHRSVLLAILMIVTALTLTGCPEDSKPQSPAPVSTEERPNISAGPGIKGEPAEGGTGVYGDTHFSDGGYSGYTDILDEEGNNIGTKFFGHPEPLPDGGEIWQAVPWEGYLGFTEDGTTIIYDEDFNVLAKVPPVDENADPKDGVERQWIPLPHKGGFWVFTNRNGQVVEVDYLEPGDSNAPDHPVDPDLLWPQPPC